MAKRSKRQAQQGTRQQAGPVNVAGIQTRALLVTLNVRFWEARKGDSEVTADVQQQRKAGKGSCHVVKRLLPAFPLFDATVARARALRQWHYDNTLPWGDANGPRVLAAAKFTDYSAHVRAEASAIAAMADDVEKAYPDMVLQAQQDHIGLGKLFKAQDYPASIRERFDVAVSYEQIPSDDIRVTLTSEQAAALEADIRAKLTAAVQVSVNDAWARLHDAVAHIADKLTDKDGKANIYRDTLISNCADLCDILRTLNITQDPELERMRARVEHHLAKLNPQTLRDSPTARADAAERAQEILDDMAGLYGVMDADGGL